MLHHKNIFVMVGAFLSILLLMVARHHPPSRRKIKEIWHGRVYWERESNTTMLRSVPEKALENVESPPKIQPEESVKAQKAVVKPMIAICAATHSKSNWRSLDDTALQNTLIPSIEKTISTSDRSKYDFRLYLAADHDDHFWLLNQNNVKTPDWLSVHIGVYDVPEHKIPFNPMMRAAYNDGAEYMVRINDDSEFMTSDWVSKAVAKLATYDPPNVGMVGPNCREGNTAIMTHDMVHRTHLDIFEHYYPDVFSAWWIDDWISKVYGPQRSTKMMDWTVKHHTHKHGTRYEVQHHEGQLLKAELEKGAAKIETWLLGSTKIKQDCEYIQRKIKDNSWNSLSKTSQDTWKSLSCEKSLIVKRPATQPSNLKKCLLVANGPSLNKQTWDFIDEMDYVLGMNKIYLGLNKYALPLNAYVVVNPLVAEQSVDPILKKISASTEKFVTISRKNKFPTGSDIHFFKSGGPVFSHTLETMNEGWTVTYVGLQILYIKGCQTVYIVGMDHHFKQQGAPNSMQTMKGDDPNHFDSSYFKGNQWHLADLKQNEKHYKIARDEYEKDGRQIIDATIDGHCTIFQKIKSMKDAKTIKKVETQKCQNMVEWKKSHGWDVCTDVISDNCVVYAIGIGRFSQWDDMMSKPPYNCEVHSFDPTPTGKKHVQSLKNPGFIYHDVGVGLIDGYQNAFVPTSGDQFTKTSTKARNGQNPKTISIPVKKIKTIMRELGHKSLDILKIDIEGGEIEILRDLFSSPVDIKSVCAEFHSESQLPLNEIDKLFENAKYIPYIPWKAVRVYLGVYLGERCWFKPPTKINPTAKISPSVDTTEYNTALSENNIFYQCLLAKMKNHQKGTILKTLGDCSQNDIYSDMLKDEPKGLCVDAGAHVGWTSVEMAKNGHEVISIEPFEGNYKQFNEETKSFSSQITLIQGGVSDSDGFACFGGATTVQTDKKNVGAQNKDITKGTSSVGAIRKGNCPKKTKVYTVDTLVSKRKVLLLKIDVQGGEFNVLKGAQKSLNNGRIKYVYFEHSKGATLETLKFLERYNYVCFEDKYQFSTSNVIRVENKEIRPEKLLSLTNGLKWMEARVPFGPVSFKEWKSFYKKLPHFTQTDILCVYRETG